MSVAVAVAATEVEAAEELKTDLDGETQTRGEGKTYSEAAESPKGEVLACEPLMTVALVAGSKKRVGSLAGS